MKKLVFILSVLFLWSCSSSQDANESNFKAALQDYYLQNKACFNIGHAFPFEMAKADSSYASKSELLGALVAADILSMSDSKVEVRGFFGTSKPKLVDGVKYELTKTGSNIAIVPTEAYWSTRRTTFCYGDYVVTKIDNFSQPESFQGVTLSEVKFFYKADNIAGWVKENKVLQARLGSVAKDIASLEIPIKASAGLILTGKGWVHEKLFSD